MLNSKEKGKREKEKVKTLRVSPRRLILVFCLLPFTFFLSSCRRDMQDQPRMKPYRANSLYNGQQPLIEGTVPRGYLRENREFFLERN